MALALICILSPLLGKEGKGEVFFHLYFYPTQPPLVKGRRK